MSDLTIQSHKGPYTARFAPALPELAQGLADTEHLLIDDKVARLYARQLAPALSGRSVLRVEATELNKSLEKIPAYVTHLLERGIKRDHALVVVGGGILQDIAAFIASCLLRGVAWRFYPTTLLAQADSCIGSKSSINVGGYKNMVGTFTPPNEVVISMDFLDTLTETEMRSGIGEMIKVHIISGWEDTRAMLRDYPSLLGDRDLLAQTLRRSLEIKKGKIEIDEFDRKERLVMNYGHTFGHAIESATAYRIPHGIGVTLGMILSNRFSEELGFLDRKTQEELRPLLTANARGFEEVPIPEDAFFQALVKDKKNQGQDISLILLRGPGQVFLHRQPNNDLFRQWRRKSLEQLHTEVAA